MKKYSDFLARLFDLSFSLVIVWRQASIKKMVGGL